MRFSTDKMMLDAVTTLLVFFVALYAQEAIQQKAKKNVTEASTITSPEKRIVVEMEWPPESNSDVDLWVKGPADLMPVGYSRTNDRQSSIQRDDKGRTDDLSAFNYEVVTITNLIAGIYVVNVHFFAPRDPEPVVVKIRASISNQGAAFKITDKQLTLTTKGQELTAFTFELDSDGTLVEGSIHTNYIPLRNQP